MQDNGHIRPLPFPWGVVEDVYIVETRRGISEELGVSDAVVSDAQRLSDFIRKQRGQIPIKYVLGNGACVVRRGMFEYVVFGKKITVYIQYVQYRTESDVRSFSQLVSPFQNGFGFSRTEPVLALCVDEIGGTVDARRLEDTIQHELHHYYQHMVMPTNSYRKAVYKVILQMKTQGATPSERKIGDALYLSHQNEIESYSNGLYALLRKRYSEEPLVSTEEVIYSSDAFGAYKQLSMYVDFFSDHINDENISLALKKLYQDTKITPQSFLKKVKKGKDVFLRQIGRAVVKAQKDSGIQTDILRYTD